MNPRLKLFIVLTAFVGSLTVRLIVDPPDQTLPERTIGIVHRGHRSSYTLPAEYERSALVPIVIIAWLLYVQGGIPLCLHPWEKVWQRRVA